MVAYISAFIVLTIVLVGHIIGLEGPYYTVESYDVAMHLLGGVGIALFVVGLLMMRRNTTFFSARNIIIGVLIVGIIWELFEITFEFTGYPLWTKLYYLDTAKDLVMDMLGGIIVAVIYSRKSKTGNRPAQTQLGA